MNSFETELMRVNDVRSDAFLNEQCVNAAGRKPHRYEMRNAERQCPVAVREDLAGAILPLSVEISPPRQGLSLE